MNKLTHSYDLLLFHYLIVANACGRLGAIDFRAWPICLEQTSMEKYTEMYLVDLPVTDDNIDQYFFI